MRLIFQIFRLYIRDPEWILPSLVRLSAVRIYMYLTKHGSPIIPKVIRHRIYSSFLPSLSFHDSDHYYIIYILRIKGCLIIDVPAGLQQTGWTG